MTGRRRGLRPGAIGHVLVVGPIPPPIHGAAVVTAGVVKLLERAGFAVVVMDSGPIRSSALGYHAQRLRVHLAALLEILRNEDFNAVYFGGSGGLGLWYHAALVLAARCRGMRVIYHHHSYNYLSSPRPAMRLITLTAGARALHLVLSDQMRRLLEDRYRKAVRILTCSNSLVVELPADTSHARLRGQSMILAHVSNLSVEKGLADVLATTVLAERSGLIVKLMLAGPLAGDAERRLLDSVQAESPGLVDYAGPIAPRDVPPFMRNADVFLFPSRYKHEAEPLVVLEAAANGTPTIAREIGTLASLVPRLGGVLVPVDADFAATAVSALPSLAGPSERELVRNSFRILHDSAIDAWSSVLLEVAGRHVQLVGGTAPIPTPEET